MTTVDIENNPIFIKSKKDQQDLIKLDKVRFNLRDTLGFMQDKVNMKMAIRDDKLGDMKNKTDLLLQESMEYNKQIKRKMCMMWLFSRFPFSFFSSCIL